MRFLVGLAVVIVLMFGGEDYASAWGYCSYDQSDEYGLLPLAPGEFHLRGDTFLSTFPHKNVPYDDYYVEVQYHDLGESKNLIVIGFGGEADECYHLKKQLVAGDSKIKFFDLLEVGTSNEIGFGSCVYQGNTQNSCEYLFNSETFGRSGRIKVKVNFVTGSFQSYILPRDGKEEALKIVANMEHYQT